MKKDKSILAFLCKRKELKRKEGKRLDFSHAFEMTG